MLRECVFILLFILLTGCATAPESLKKSERREEIHLVDAVSIVSYRGMRVRCEEGALPGVYTAEAEDEKGIYFYGVNRPIWSTNEVLQKLPRLYEGGIYIPHDRSTPPQFFYIFETDSYVVESIDSVVQTRIGAASSEQVDATGPSHGVSVAGNVVGGILVGAIIQANVGRIEKFPPIQDSQVRNVILTSLRSAP
jgi:hypothetical protein